MMKNLLKKCCLMIFVVFISVSLVSADNFDSESLPIEGHIRPSETGPVRDSVDIDKTEYTEISLFQKPLFFAFEAQFSSELMGDYELDETASDDLVEVEPALSATLLYQPGEKISIFFEISCLFCLQN